MDTEQPASPESAPVKDRTISKESAQEQLNLLLEMYMIDASIIDDDDQRSAIQTTINKLESAVIKGYLEIVIGEKGLEVRQYTQYTQNKSIFIYGELSGKTKYHLDKVAGRYDRIHTVLGLLSDKGSEEIKKLKGADMAIAEALGTLFLFA